jgi:hypothetical protein
MDRAKDDLSPLEEAVLTTLLRHDHPTFAALRRQQEVCRVESREFTGVGFFTTLTAPLDQHDSRRIATGRPLLASDQHALETDRDPRGNGVIDLHADEIADAILSLVRGTATF